MADRGRLAFQLPPTAPTAESLLPTQEGEGAGRGFLRSMLEGLGVPGLSPMSVGSRGVAILPRATGIFPNTIRGLPDLTEVVYRLRNAFGQPPFRGSARVQLSPEGTARIPEVIVRRGEGPYGGVLGERARLKARDPGGTKGADITTSIRATQALAEELRKAGVGRIEAVPLDAGPTGSASRRRLFQLLSREAKMPIDLF